MARKADPSSVRQQALKYLGTQTRVKREVVIERLMERFTIGQPYAATLYAQYRTNRKEAGTMIKVYSIRETKNGKPVTPYLKVENVLRPAADAALSPAEAMELYLAELSAKESVVVSLLESL